MRSSTRLWSIALGALLAIPLIGAVTAEAASAATPASTSVSAVAIAAPSVGGQLLGSGVRPATRCCHVTIPSNYQYHPNSGPQVTLHDYCSHSPDEFSVPGTNANFRGACARHDMCYQYHQQSQHGCDNSLFVNLGNECTYTYAWYDPRRAACIDTAAVYWAAVTIHTYWP